MLRAELGFYVGCLNLREQLTTRGQPVCYPAPAALSGDRLSARGLYDASLALIRPGGGEGVGVTGNDVAADGKQLIMITGANQGGKSTFLRSLGQAQLMMQARHVRRRGLVRRQRLFRRLHPLQARGRRHDGEGQARRGA